MSVMARGNPCCCDEDSLLAKYVMTECCSGIRVFTDSDLSSHVDKVVNWNSSCWTVSGQVWVGTGTIIDIDSADFTPVDGCWKLQTECFACPPCGITYKESDSFLVSNFSSNFIETFVYNDGETSSYTRSFNLVAPVVLPFVGETLIGAGGINWVADNVPASFSSIVTPDPGGHSKSGTDTGFLHFIMHCGRDGEPQTGYSVIFFPYNRSYLFRVVAYGYCESAYVPFLPPGDCTSLQGNARRGFVEGCGEYPNRTISGTITGDPGPYTVTRSGSMSVNTAYLPGVGTAWV